MGRYSPRSTRSQKPRLCPRRRSRASRSQAFPIDTHHTHRGFHKGRHPLATHSQQASGHLHRFFPRHVRAAFTQRSSHGNAKANAKAARSTVALRTSISITLWPRAAASGSARAYRRAPARRLLADAAVTEELAFHAVLAARCAHSSFSVCVDGKPLSGQGV